MEKIDKIKMIDLQGQYKRIDNEIDQAIKNVFNKCAFINGQEVQEFNESLKWYLTCKKVTTCGNGTDALQLALMSLGAKPGMEVIVPGFTYVATAEVICVLGLTPVFVDVDTKYFTIDVQKVSEAITGNTFAIMPVNLFGQTAPIEDLKELVGNKNIYLIEDNAQAIGSDYKLKSGQIIKSGNLSDFATTSFFPTKNLGCYGDGGAVYTNNVKLGELCSKLANHGQTSKYVHDYIGINSRLDTIQAAILNIKLKYLDEWTKIRSNISDKYDDMLSEIEEIEIPSRAPYSTHVFHQYTIKIKNGKRDSLQKYLKRMGVPSVIYYPIPVHLQKGYEAFKPKEPLSITESLVNEVLSIPIHSEMNGNTQNYIIENIQEFFKSNYHE